MTLNLLSMTLKREKFFEQDCGFNSDFGNQKSQILELPPHPHLTFYIWTLAAVRLHLKRNSSTLEALDESFYDSLSAIVHDFSWESMIFHDFSWFSKTFLRFSLRLHLGRDSSTFEACESFMRVRERFSRPARRHASGSGEEGWIDYWKLSNKII